MECETINCDNFSVNATEQSVQNTDYEPVQHHWFYKKESKGSWDHWCPFSKFDSQILEESYCSDRPIQEKIVPTDGGRFDVDIEKRIKTPVYWEQEAVAVQRCSWFYKSSTTAKYQPYGEELSAHLEEEYARCFRRNQWNHQVKLPNNDTIVFNSSNELLLFPPSMSADDWSNAQTHVRHRIRRGILEFEIDDGEPQKVDHLLFMVHGIGSVCDLKLRTVQEVVDDFRSISLQLVRTHYVSSYEKGEANRIEVLPISWHSELHSEDTGIDKKLKSITLDTIPKLRDFANDTILDVLFYTSPKYSQKILSTVGNELNRLYDLFKKRNPKFEGNVSLGGHSLGSLILFDLLSHQQTPNNDVQNEPISSQEKKLDRRISHMYGAAGSGFAKIDYPKLCFEPTALFAMGSPIGMFMTVRGLDSLGEDFSLPTCSAFFNIFHPYDPVAYRVESLINSSLSALEPKLIPHHKGRKRMHLELKDTMVKVGADLKQKVMDSVKHTWNTFFQMGLISTNGSPCIEEQPAAETEECLVETTEDCSLTKSLGKLNKGRRVDYVLQESPFAMFNGYVSAITSHVCYWESEDTMLFIIKEIYSTMNINPDNQIPQATMTIERPLDSTSNRH